MSLIKNQWQSAALLSLAGDVVDFYARLCIISLSMAQTIKIWRFCPNPISHFNSYLIPLESG